MIFISNRSHIPVAMIRSLYSRGMKKRTYSELPFLHFAFYSEPSMNNPWQDPRSAVPNVRTRFSLMFKLWEVWTNISHTNHIRLVETILRFFRWNAFVLDTHSSSISPSSDSLEGDRVSKNASATALWKSGLFNISMKSSSRSHGCMRTMSFEIQLPAALLVFMHEIL